MNDSSQPQIENAVLSAILATAVDSIITIDVRGSIESVNPATQRVFGYSAEELLGQNIKILMPNPYRDEHDDYLNNYVKGGEKKIIGIGREVVGQRKDGTTFPMHLAVSEIVIDDRRVFAGIVRDISDLKEAQQELAEANERLESRVEESTTALREAQADLVRSEKFATLGKVSGGIAHEIRNPLNAVKTSAYFLLNAKTPTQEKVREHLQRIDRQVTLIDNVVTALSDVAKLPDAILQASDLRATLMTVVKSLELPESIQVDLLIPDQEIKVLVDSNQIMIAFKNLVRNARDAMPDGGTLSITQTVAANSVAYHVVDTGVGIAPKDLDQILEPLFTTKARGMGLGLSITRTIVEKNQGSLYVKSELGVGSRFTIELTRAL